MIKGKEFYHRNDNINFLLKRKLSFMLRYGMTIFIGLMFMVLLCLHFLKAPDIIEGSFVLSSNNPPKNIVSKVSGQIVKMFVSDSLKVDKGSELLILESVADINEIKQLENKLEQIQPLCDNNRLENIEYLGTDSFQNLGEIQQHYEQFKKNNNEIYLTLSNGNLLQEKNIISARLINLRQVKINLNNQKLIYEREYVLADETWQADSILNLQKGITKPELRNSESARLQRKLNLNNVQQRLLDNANAIIDIEKQLLELERKISQQKSVFIQNFSILKSAIADWKSKYVIVSPSSGTVSFNKNIHEGLNIQAGDPLIYIIPDSNIWVFEVLIPQENFGKIKINQKAILKFNSYNFEEFGVAKGTVQSISSTPQEVQSIEGIQYLYLIKIGLNSELKTNYNVTIKPRFGLTGTAAIILDEKSILEKLFLDRFKSIFVTQ